MLEQIETQIKSKVGNARCPEHGRHPTLTAKGRNLDSLSFEVHGCCEKMMEEVKRRLH